MLALEDWVEIMVMIYENAHNDDDDDADDGMTMTIMMRIKVSQPLTS